MKFLHGTTLVEEPLRASARLARRLASRLCRPIVATSQSCAPLHGFWQCLRLLALAADPARHAAFYEEALVAAPVGATPRVLISGTADYSMLAHALAAYRARGVEPEITVLDACDAPLQLNRWYARRVGCRLETQRCSVLDYTPAAPFDAVCTHSFLAMFPRGERPLLVDSWRRLLRPGGRLVTANALRPWGPDGPNRFTPEQADWVRKTVGARCAELAELLASSAEEVMRQAERYLGARYGYPVRSPDELRALFEQGGFDLEHLELFAPAPAARPELGGPGLRKADVRYAHLIATRRQPPRR
jgi:SAM-dependent methyltransferase